MAQTRLGAVSRALRLAARGGCCRGRRASRARAGAGARAARARDYAGARGVGKRERHRAAPGARASQASQAPQDAPALAVDCQGGAMRLVRPADARDARALATMLGALLAEHQIRYPDTYPRLDPVAGAAFYGAEWGRRLGTDPSCNVWLAADRDIRGFLAGEVWSRPVGEPPSAFFVEWVYVVPEHRKTGISRALFRDGLLPYCRRHGIDVVEGRTVPGDEQWARRGWATTAVSVMRGVDALTLDVAERRDDRVGEGVRQ